VSKRGQGALDLAADKAHALKLTPVSRETEKRLDTFVDALLLWQKTMNLVASSTLARLWTRHIADSLQLIPLAPRARIWVDLGSGAGFPGMPVACALADMPGAKVHLVESNAKKAAFLREAVRITGVHGPGVVTIENPVSSSISLDCARRHWSVSKGSRCRC
jgi:16S rRNA (guanine527-N7)-methyltransferase